MNGLMNQQAAAASAAAGLALPPLPGTSDVATAPSYTPPLQNPSATALRGYGLDGGTVYVQLGYYQQQTYGRKLVSSVNSLVEGEDKRWQMVASGNVVANTGGEPTRWRAATLLGGAVSASAQQRERVEVRQTYWAGGRITDSGARATVYTVLGKLAGQGDAAAMITVYTEEADPAKATARLDAFLRAHAAALERQLVTHRSPR
jgi:EpsI family protein